MSLGKKLQKELKKSFRNQSLNLVFVGPAESKRLNRRFRSKNRPTDVLSFASDEPGVLGELVLCPVVLRRQAKEQGHSFELELGYMIIHGALHLCGYDHERSRAEEKRMFSLQDRIFASICDAL